MKDIVDDVLAHISNEWFGVPDGKYVAYGGWHWRPDLPTCPGHFHSPSRYMFQPNPGPQASLVGQQHGQVLQRCDRPVLRKHGTERAGNSGTAIVRRDIKEDQLTSTLIGVMMGFLPTVDGNIRGALFEWINDRSLWDLSDSPIWPIKPKTSLKKAGRILMRPLERTLLLRPVPELGVAHRA